ncbi:MAG TPA: outer membrane beta-barrel protein [Bacteroidota bacterium]|nr:outer membrane beta-barrel protein [Bacteroidota bacterium]
MKRAVITVVLAVFVLSALSYAQTTSTVGNWRVGVGLDAGLPTGDFNNVSSFGIGGHVGAGYVVDPNAVLSLKIGYLHFSGKDVTVTVDTPLGPVTETASGGSLSVVPILVGGKYFFSPPGDMRWYGAADIGLYIISASGGGSSASSSKFGVSPAFGGQFKAGDNMWVDAHVNYTDVFTDVSSSSWIGIGVGLIFDLKQ